MASLISYFQNTGITLLSMVWFDLWCLTPLSAISWRSVLLVEKTGVPGENNRPVASH